MKLREALGIRPSQPERPVLTARSMPAEYQAVWEYDLADSARQAAEARQKANYLREQRRTLRAQREANRPTIVGAATTFQAFYELQPVRGLHIRLCEVKAERFEDLHTRLQEAFDAQRIAIAMETIDPAD